MEFLSLGTIHYERFKSHVMREIIDLCLILFYVES